VGQLRFAAPVEPANNRSAGVQDGSYGKICYQASVGPGSSSSSTPDPLQSEDCLFLDVIVSSDILQSSGAPVLVWIYGGAFVLGSKVINGGNPAGSLQRSREESSKGVIYVAMNYRVRRYQTKRSSVLLTLSQLGAFGFLSGTTLQANGSANAGILDQRAALNWVQKYIHLFGGDPDKVTVFGESAGGSSIMHHITAYGGQTTVGSTPFQAALTQSAAIYPYTSQSDLDKTFNAYLAEAGVNSLSELRQLSSATLQKASLSIISQAPTGTFGWGM
jgi:cholinesterase